MARAEAEVEAAAEAAAEAEAAAAAARSLTPEQKQIRAAQTVWRGRLTRRGLRAGTIGNPSYKMLRTRLHIVKVAHSCTIPMENPNAAVS